MALNRPVETSHARGLAGKPSFGQRSSAARTASCSASSARSKTDASAKYEYTCEPIACEEKEGKTVVTSHLVGNFPGSPVDLRFFFELQDDKIAALEIIP